MNKFYAAGFLFFFSISLIKGQSNLSLLKERKHYSFINLAQSRFEVKAFNDNWGGGFTKIHDDLRSYGLETNYLFPKKIMGSVRFSGLTFRRGEFDVRQRTDELWINIERPIYLFKKDRGAVYGSFGGYFFGKLLNDWFQNRIHESFGLSKLELPYEVGNSAFAEIGLSLNYRFFQMNLKKDLSIFVDLETKENLTFNYFNSFQVRLPFSIRSSSGDYFTMKVGYDFMSIFTEKLLLEEVLKSESGFRIGFKAGFGKLLFYYDIFPNKDFSTGGIGLRIPLKTKTKSTFEQTDFSAEIGFLNDGNGYFSKFLFAQRKLFPKRLFPVIYHGYWTYLKKRLIDYPALNGHFRQIGIGGDFRFFKPKSGWQINPFVSGVAGVKKIATYAGEQPAETIDQNLFFAQTDLGLRVKLPDYFWENRIRYGGALFYRMSYQSINDTDPVSKRLTNFEKNERMIGAGIFVQMSF